MPCKRYKNKTNLLKQFKLETADRKHYYHVYIWKDVKSLKENVLDATEDTKAIVCHMPHIIEFEDCREERIYKPKMGEIHLSIEYFNEAVVAHELFHAMLGRIRYLDNPTFEEVINQEVITYNNYSDISAE